jgi:hypothetical protein
MPSADTRDPMRRDSKDQLFFVQVKVAPGKDNREAAKCGGGIASAWVDAEVFEEAVEKTFSRIKEVGWGAVTFMHWEMVRRDTYSAAVHGENNLRMIHQCIAIAMKHGVGLMLATWPKRGRRKR